MVLQPASQVQNPEFNPQYQIMMMMMMARCIVECETLDSIPSAEKKKREGALIRGSWDRSLHPVSLKTFAGLPAVHEHKHV